MTEEIAGWRRRSQGELPCSNLYEQIALLENARPHGEVFEYRSILTDLLGWIMERATGDAATPSWSAASCGRRSAPSTMPTSPSATALPCPTAACA